MVTKGGNSTCFTPTNPKYVMTIVLTGTHYEKVSVTMLQQGWRTMAGTGGAATSAMEEGRVPPGDMTDLGPANVQEASEGDGCETQGYSDGDSYEGVREQQATGVATPTTLTLNAGGMWPYWANVTFEGVCTIRMSERMRTQLPAKAMGFRNAGDVFRCCKELCRTEWQQMEGDTLQRHPATEQEHTGTSYREYAYRDTENSLRRYNGVAP